MKLCQWNIENLFLLMDKYSGEDLKTISNEQWQALSIGYKTPNKHIQKIEDAAKVILDIDADIYLLCEVGGKESLDNFNKFFLDNNYYTFIKKGTAARGLDVGFLVNKRFTEKIECYDNRKIKLSDGSCLSRTLGEIHILKEDKIDLVLLLAHLKSKHRQEGDFQGVGKRQLEIQAINSHIEKLNEKYNNPNILLAGDMNSDLEDLKMMGLKDMDNFLDFKDLNEKEKCTHVHFDGGAIYHQFDYIFSSKNMKNRVNLKESFVYRFKNDYGDILDLPEKIKDKFEHPSDHYPVILVLDR